MSAPTLPIHTHRLVLRAHRPDDLDRLLEVYNDPATCRFTPLGPWDRADGEEQVARRVLRTDYRGEAGILGLVMDVDGVMVGDVVLFPVADSTDTAEIGWALHPGHRGHGYTEEAARAVLDLAFGHYGLHRVVAHVDAENLPSNRICERLGMRREAHHLQSQWHRGEWRDMIVHALLAREWPPEGTPCSTSSSSS